MTEIDYTKTEADPKHLCICGHMWSDHEWTADSEVGVVKFCTVHNCACGNFNSHSFRKTDLK